MSKKIILMRLKDVIDILFSSLLIMLSTPLLMVISIAIKLDSTGPAIFKQQRVGRNGALFNVYKFRTMVVNADQIGLGYNIEKDDQRITTVGKFLRSWSLDELPQMINIIKGQMSFVGPRPALPYQVAAYTQHQRTRLEMKPGITGYAQVNGRNNIPWEKRIEFDVWYVENWSLWLDMTILAKTFKVVAKRESIYNHDGISYDFGKENNDPLNK